MTFEFIDFIALFTVIQLLFLTVVSFNYKKGRKLSNRILSGFLISNALLIAHWLLARYKWISLEQWITLYSIGGSFYLLLMPFLYLYIRSLCYQDFNLKVIHLLHAVPFVGTVLFRLFVNLTARKAGILDVSNLLAIQYWGYQVVMHLQIISYLIASVIMLVAYRKQLKNVYSSIEKIDLAWCNLLLIAFAVMWFIDMSAWIFRSLNVVPEPILHFMLILSILINLSFTLVVTYKGLTQSESLSGIQAFPKYAASRLKQSDCEAIIQELTLCMKTEKPYLTPSLSVDDLARKLKIPARHLSQAIHTCLNQNFYDFINSYRIEESKKYIRDESYSNQTLLAIAYDAGFNSKSVFNASFKKNTGLTPKEYKQRSDRNMGYSQEC